MSLPPSPNSVLQFCLQCCANKSTTGFLDFAKSAITLAALPFGALTFWLGYRQKEKERTRSYYKEAVIDQVLPDILKIFDEQIVALTVSGREALKGVTSVRKTTPHSCRIALAAFAVALFGLQDRVVQRTSIFDEDVTLKLEDAFQETQDELTAWFNDVNLHKRRDINEIGDILRSNQRRIIRMIYKGEARPS